MKKQKTHPYDAPLDISRIRALCFDVDGTLSDTDDQFVENLVRLLKPLRIVLPIKALRTTARKLVMATETPANFLYGIPDRLGLDDEFNKLGEAIYQLGLGRSPAPFKLIPGVESTLQQCKSVYPLAVVSARGKRSTGRFLEQFDLKKYFTCIATAQTAKYTKPYPDPIFWAAERLGVQPEECLMIGDTTVDIQAAQRARAQSVGVLCGFGQRQELVNAGANLILDTTSHLVRVLFSVSNVESDI